MNRTYLYPKWLCSFLLLLFVLEANSQTEFEYWFDSYSNPKTISLRISNGLVSPSLDTGDLSQGFHTLNMRLRDADGMYSPVSTSTFFKYSGTGISNIEYWFDDDVEHIGTAIINADYEDVQLVDLDLSDVEKFPLGVHQLNMRVAVNGGFYSPVYSTMILKMPNGTGDSMLEYWFDDNFLQMVTVPVNIEGGEVQILDLDLSNTVDFPYGFHKLNMRIASNGNQYGPIYSSYVMRLPQGLISQITYWLDDDYKNKRVVTGRISNGEITQLDTSLDFSTVSSGMHRLMYRISAKGNETGVIYEVPILVTRRYNDQPIVTILKEHHWLDEVTNTPTLVSNPQSIITKSYILDPAYYEVGQHAFYVQYQNSAEVWSEVNVTYFYKEESSRLRIGMRPEDDVTGIEDVISNDATFQIYTLDGKQVETMQPGVNIIHYPDGSTKKVFVK